MTRQSIVLIGPSGVGKTTVGKLLGDHLGMTFLDLDDLRDRHYEDFGIDRNAEREAYARDGLEGITSYWKPFEALSVERVLREHPDGHVIAFGAGQSVYRTAEHTRRVTAALAPFRHVILLLPSEDPEQTLEVLMGRIAIDPEAPDDATVAAFRPILREHVESESNRSLATSIVITGTQPPDAIVRMLDRIVNDTDSLAH